MHLEHENDVLKLENDSFQLTNNHVLFPELVWKLVLGKIGNPIDIECCSNASPYFWTLLKSKRQTKVIYPRILQSLSRFFHKYKSGGDNESTSENGRVSMKHFWKLRETCKCWNTVIEHLHHSVEAGHFEVENDMEIFENNHLNKWANDLFEPETLPQQFLHHFDTTHYNPVQQKPKKNPFLGRSAEFYEIVLGNQAQDEDQMYFAGILEMLTKYGAEIWYAFFNFEDMAGTNLVEIYVGFVEFLKLMPNLKRLRVMVTCEDLEEAEMQRRMNQRALEDQTIQNPIPTLSYLEFLSTTDLPSQMFNELLEKNRHISKLQVEKTEQHSTYSLFDVSLPNLAALDVTLCSLEDYESFEQCKTSLRLQKFYFRYKNPFETFSWLRLFMALGRHLGTNCRELLVEMPLHKTEYQSIQTFNDTHFGRLNLPNLKQITIISDDSISLDFLLPAKNSLQAIYMRNLDGDEDEFLLKRFAYYESEQLVKFIGFKEIMEDSNIWVELPMLVNLMLFRKMDMGGNVEYICHRGLKGDCILEKDRWYHKRM